MPSSLKSDATAAVQALQQWYGADSYAAGTGLWSWPASAQDVANYSGTSVTTINLVQAAGFLPTFADTTCWWNSANALTALIDYMLITGDQTHLSVVDNTFTKAPTAWRPNLPAVENAAAWGGIVGGVVGFFTGFFTCGLPCAIAGAIIGGATTATAAAVGAALLSGKTYNTNFLDDFYDDDGWWALAWIKAYDLTGDTRYLDMGVTIFQEMVTGWDKICGGGIYWQISKQDTNGNAPYKNAIANELFFAVAAGLYRRLKNLPPHWVYFQGTNDALWRVLDYGSQQLQLGGNWTSATPCVADGWVYFQGTDSRLLKCDTNGNRDQWLNNETKSTPFVAGGWVYFQGTDNRLLKCDIDGLGSVRGTSCDWLNNWTLSTPFVADGWVYFQGTDNRLLKCDTNGNRDQWLNNETKSTPFVAGGWVYFQGTDNRLLKCDIDGLGSVRGTSGDWLNNWTSSTPFVADGWVYFRGTDNRLLKCDTNGNNGSQIGSNTTSSTPFVTPDGWVFFRGTDNRLWKVYKDGSQQLQISNDYTATTPFVSAAGPPAFDDLLSWANSEWRWFQASGLINSNNLINDTFSDVPSCKPDSKQPIFCYTQGVILGALCDMYQITSDESFLAKAEQIADALISTRVGTLITGHILSGGSSNSATGQSGVDGNGILTEFPEAAPFQNYVGSKGIFARNLGYLALQTKNQKYAEFLRKNALSALQFKNNANQFGSSWDGPIDVTDFIRQTSAVDLLNAAVATQSMAADISYLVPLLLS